MLVTFPPPLFLDVAYSANKEEIQQTQKNKITLI
jgi:hypothetical protein